MTTNTEIFNLLSNDAGLTAIVGTSIYPVTAPQDATFPLLVFRREDGGGEPDMDGQGDMIATDLQIDAVAETLAESVSVVDAVRTLLKNYTGLLDTRRVIRTTLNSEYDEFAPKVDAGVFHSSQSWTIWHY